MLRRPFLRQEGGDRITTTTFSIKLGELTVTLESDGQIVTVTSTMAPKISKSDDQGSTLVFVSGRTIDAGLREIFDSNLDSFEFSKRLDGALYSLRTEETRVGHVLLMSENQLLKVKNLGRKTLRELKEHIQDRFGIEIGDKQIIEAAQVWAREGTR